jgi:hypothetical protein
MAACFDPDTLTWAGAWTGGFLKFSAERKGFLSGCMPVGERVELPAEPPATKGSLYITASIGNGSRVVFHYTRDGSAWLDSAWCEGGRFVRTRVAVGSNPLASLTKPGTAQWSQVLETKANLEAVHPMSSIPSRYRPRHPGVHCFTWVTTISFQTATQPSARSEGEVWLVRGIDETLQRVRWKRFAAGLHEPLGLKIADGKSLRAWQGSNYHSPRHE